MDNIYRHVIESDLVRVMKNGTVYKFYERKNKFQEAPLIGTSRDKKYKVITVSVNKTQYHLYVHRLVAFAYIPNPDNKPTVNHIDGNTENNNAKNLQWATYSEQIKHAYDLGLIDPMRNAVVCKYCEELTRAEDGVCTNCKYNFRLARNKGEAIEGIRRELEMIDLRALTLREQEITYQRYLGRTYEEIGESYDLSRQRIEAIIKNAKLKVFSEPVYPVLERCLLDKDIDLTELASYCDLTELTIRNRLKGKSDWKLKEAIRVKKHLKSKQGIEQLFYRVAEV